MKPPKGGPMTGPSIAGTVRYDIAWTRSDFGTLLSTSSRPTGTIIAPPKPCTIRARTSCGSDCDTPQNTDPIVNTTMAMRNTVRAPNLSAIQPLIGMNTARLRRYEVIARLSRIGSSCIERAIAGSAVAITVESNDCMKSEQPTISGIKNSNEDILPRLSFITTSLAARDSVWESTTSDRLLPRAPSHSTSKSIIAAWQG